MIHNPDDENKIKLRENNLAKIDNRIIVMSGKGGVGKSTVSVNLAYGLVAKGKRVGILDVDLHGPSISTMTGISDFSLQYNEEGQPVPIEIVKNLHVLSIAPFLENNDVAIIWRGPMKMGVIKQFFEDILWPDLDYLIIDCPPGTGDEPLSVVQIIKEITGTVIVSTPQEVSLADVRKSIDFSKKLNLKILGLVENMSGFVCPDCGKRVDIFKSGGAEKTCENMSLDLLGSIPIEPEIVNSCDKGVAYLAEFEDSETGKVYSGIVDKIIEKTS